MDNDLLKAVATLESYPVTYDSEGNDWFYCPFCEVWGFFPSGNGGIGHSTDCAVALAFRLMQQGAHNAFDELAYKSILHQLAQMTNFPSKRHPNDSLKWVPYCPFCEQIFQEGEHAETCIVRLAKSPVSK